LLLCAALNLLVACVDEPALRPIPSGLVSVAQIPGFIGVRQWGEASGAKTIIDARSANAAVAQRSNGPLNVLALSGGAADGAFGAGFLTGWTQTRTRPQFHVVTGVSVGALIAPFAFLGAQYDDVLKQLLTELSGKSAITPRSRLFALLGDSLASPRPLESLIAAHFNERIMGEVAVLHRAGRRLYVSTSHIYAGREVIWDIGAIANSGRGDALALIHRVLLASAAVPILLPPVYFEVEAGGQRYNEMHVDGGIMRQMFIAPPGFDWDAAGRKLGTDGHINFYVIRNGRTRSEYMVMQPNPIGLGEHAMFQLTQSLGIGDLYMIYMRAQREHASFRAAWIDDAFAASWTQWYDPQYVRALFEYGHAQARGANVWHALPPGIKSETDRTD
jgi:hypothetical protein